MKQTYDVAIIGAGISGLIGWGIGKAVDGLTKLVHASQFKMSPKLWTKLESFLYSRRS